MKQTMGKVAAMLAIFLIFIVAIGFNTSESLADQLFDVGITSSQIVFYPKASYHSITLNVSMPDGSVRSELFATGAAPFLVASRMPDGKYTYELRIGVAQTNLSRRSDDSGLPSSATGSTLNAISQSGHFLIKNGSFYVSVPLSKRKAAAAKSITQSKAASADLTNDVVHADDAIITGSLCVGFDCLTDGTENYGFDTIKLKENNLRILFDDTSATAGFPANDWRITVNDSSSGGANFFSIDDATGAIVPFKIMAGARANSLFVSSTGRVGIGTAVPVLDMHITRGDSPSLRLDQDTSSGWTAQVWDIAGNESNFFIRDTTGGSKLPFRIQPATPTNTLTLKNDGKVGIGT
jgi:hypothetical protein